MITDKVYKEFDATSQPYGTSEITLRMILTISYHSGATKNVFLIIMVSEENHIWRAHNMMQKGHLDSN